MSSAQCYLETVFFCAPAAFLLCSKMKWKTRKKCLRLNKRDTHFQAVNMSIQKQLRKFQKGDLHQGTKGTK